MIYAIFAFLALFLLMASGGLLLFFREGSSSRVDEAIQTRSKPKSVLGSLRNAGSSLRAGLESFQNVLPKSKQEVSIVLVRLGRAGYREESAVRMFYGSKVALPLLLCALALMTGLSKMVGPFFVYATALGVGYLLPDFWLGKRISARQKRIRLGLPDVLDLIVICVEAGLSLDHATARSAQELKTSHPDLCDELKMVVLEQRAGRARSEAWKMMAERTDEASIRNLVSMIVQSEQFGTSVAKTLRIHSDTLRKQRIQSVEEQAAKTSVKLVFPLVLFIFPALFLVCLGPAVIVMMESFKSLLGK